MMKSDFYGCIMSLWGFSCHRSGVQGEGGRMFTWNFHYISKSRLSETLNQLNLNKYSEALKNADSESMKRLIAEGRELKEENLRHRVGQPN